MPTNNWLPPDYNCLNPHLIVKDAVEAIKFYKKAFGATERCCMKNPENGQTIHAEVKIGNSVLMLCEECPDYGALSPLSLNGSPVTIHLYVENVDETFNTAIAAGAKETLPPTDMFWGDRYARLTDPFGHS